MNLYKIAGTQPCDGPICCFFIVIPIHQIVLLRVDSAENTPLSRPFFMPFASPIERTHQDFHEYWFEFYHIDLHTALESLSFFA